MNISASKPSSIDSPGLASRSAVVVYSAISYLLFLAVFLYLIAFVGDFAVPQTVNQPAASVDLLPALLINILLIAAFGVQHSVMARPAFKKWLTRFIPAAAERATYVLATNLVLVVLYVFWQPLPATLWSFESPALRGAMWGAYGAGWGIVLLSSFLLSHFELFGLKQAWFHLRRQLASPPTFKTPLLYRLVRHPLMTGFLIAMWATPDMTVGRLLFAAGMTVYIAIGVHHEEKDLVDTFGERYERYRREVPSVIPGLPRPTSSPETATGELA